MREDYFREYCKIMKEERKKEKDGKEKEKGESYKKLVGKIIMVTFF